MIWHIYLAWTSQTALEPWWLCSMEESPFQTWAFGAAFWINESTIHVLIGKIRKVCKSIPWLQKAQKTTMFRRKQHGRPEKSPEFDRGSVRSFCKGLCQHLDDLGLAPNAVPTSSRTLAPWGWIVLFLSTSKIKVTRNVDESWEWIWNAHFKQLQTFWNIFNPQSSIVCKGLCCKPSSKNKPWVPAALGAFSQCGSQSPPWNHSEDPPEKPTTWCVETCCESLHFHGPQDRPRARSSSSFAWEPIGDRAVIHACLTNVHNI